MQYQDDDEEINRSRQSGDDSVDNYGCGDVELYVVSMEE